MAGLTAGSNWRNCYCWWYYPVQYLWHSSPRLGTAVCFDGCSFVRWNCGLLDVKSSHWNGPCTCRTLTAHGTPYKHWRFFCQTIGPFGHADCRALFFCFKSPYYSRIFSRVAAWACHRMLWRSAICPSAGAVARPITGPVFLICPLWYLNYWNKLMWISIQDLFKNYELYKFIAIPFLKSRGSACKIFTRRFLYKLI